MIELGPDMDPNWMLRNIAFFFIIGYAQECQTVLIQIRPYVLLGLMLVKIVCKDYQQMPQSKDESIIMKKTRD